MSDFATHVGKNLPALVGCTVVSLELCINLSTNNLVTQSEYEELKKHAVVGEFTKAAECLYGSIVKKFDERCTKIFHQNLLDTKNLKAVEILFHQPSENKQDRNGAYIPGPPAITLSTGLSKEENKFIKRIQRGEYSCKGTFEGFNKLDENLANQLIRFHFNVDHNNGWRFTESTSEFCFGMWSSAEFIEYVRRTCANLANQVLWWNPKKILLPKKYIPRRIQHEGVGVHSGDPSNTTWFQKPFQISFTDVINSEHRLILLSDVPGMGKSSLTTKYEEELRRTVENSRIVLRLNFNSMDEDFYSNLDEADFAVTTFISSCASYLPNLEELCKVNDNKIYLLLDGLDEICPKHEEAMIRILTFLLKTSENIIENNCTRDSAPQGYQLHQIFLTTRPHLQEKLAQKFKPYLISLLPLDFEEQVWYLSQQVPNYSADEAKTALMSLPPTIRPMFQNPLMLFLFSQLTANFSDPLMLKNTDLFQLYEKFIQEKHKLFLKEKEFIDTRKQFAERQIKNMLASNLYQYYCIALKELNLYDLSNWSKKENIAEQDDYEEILSYGLLYINSQSKPYFVHRSLAEFFIARLFTDKSVSDEVKQVLLTRVYSYKGQYDNIESFLFFALKYTFAEELVKNPGLVIISKGWLDGEGNAESILKNFINGKLFNVIGVETLSSCVDLLDDKFVATLKEAAMDNKYISLLQWLAKQDRSYIRKNVLPVSPSPNEVTLRTNRRLLARMLFLNALNLQLCFTDEEIRIALSSCDNIADVIKLDLSGLNNWKVVVHSIMSKKDVAQALTCDKCIWNELPSQELSWWIAEVMPVQELLGQISYYPTRVTDLLGNSPQDLLRIWGKEVLENYHKYQFKFGRLKGSSVFQSTGKEFTKQLLMSSEIKEADVIDVLAGDLQITPHFSTLSDLEALCQNLNKQECEKVRKVLKGFFKTAAAQWNSPRFPNIELLPYTILYSDSIVLDQFHISESAGDTPTNTIFCVSLLLCLFASETNEKFYAVKAKIFWFLEILKREKRDFPISKTCVKVILDAEINHLRKIQSLMSCNWDGQIPRVSQISYGEFMIHMNWFHVIDIDECNMKLVICDFLEKSRKICDSSVHHFILGMDKIVKPFFVEKLLLQITQRRHEASSLLHKRLRDLLIFFLQQNQENLIWIIEQLSCQFLMKIIVEIKIPSDFDVNPSESKSLIELLALLQQHFTEKFKVKERNPQELLLEFPSFKTEVEWHIVLEICRVTPPDEILDEVNLLQVALRKVYENPTLPFLRVWMQIFGVDETRTLVEKESLFENFGMSVDAVLLAVELGSLAFLQYVAWPSLLLWKNNDGKNLLDISLQIWGKRHVVTQFLAEKFKLPYCTNRK